MERFAGLDISARKLLYTLDSDRAYFTPDGQKIVTMSRPDKQGMSMGTYDAASGKLLLRFGECPYGIEGRSNVVFPDNRTVAPPYLDAQRRWWDLTTGKLLPKRTAADYWGNKEIGEFDDRPSAEFKAEFVLPGDGKSLVLPRTANRFPCTTCMPMTRPPNRDPRRFGEIQRSLVFRVAPEDRCPLVAFGRQRRYTRAGFTNRRGSGPLRCGHVCAKVCDPFGGRTFSRRLCSQPKERRYRLAITRPRNAITCLPYYPSRFHRFPTHEGVGDGDLRQFA